MHKIRQPGIKKFIPYSLGGQLIIFILPCLFSCLAANTQICPPNIDFETGTFDNWTCYTGTVSAAGGQNSINIFPSGGPVPNQHTMYTAGQTNELDYYGGFPVNCPNGSGHSIRLGNNEAGGQAEGISYEFTIPDNADIYSLIYHYAVVFQDPNHQEFQQPRLEIEITNVTDNEVIHCSSFTFIPYGSILPGFFISPRASDTTSVWCKDWSAVSVNLNGNAGKTIRLFFKTADCTFVRHFGYAYIDVNSECSSEFVGATYCPNDRAINVTAPYGYQNYNWYNSSFTQLLGSQQSITFAPPPPVGSTIAVEVVPYDGYGCLDTLYALLIDTLTVTSNAGRDTLSCNHNTVQIGANPVPGLIYSWSPAAGLSNPAISNPRAGPAVPTMYILTTSSFGGGCIDTDTVFVNSSIVDTSLLLLGKDAFCITSGDSAVLLVPPTNSIQWYKNGSPISGANQATYKVIQSGTYSALLRNNEGCTLTTSEKQIVIETPRPGINYPVQNAVVDIPLQLEARNFGSTVLWRPANNLNNPNIIAPIFNGKEEKLYLIDITTAGGCLTVDTQIVKVFKEIKFYVPSGFTPNQDGLNDYLKPIQAGIKELKYFRIYNRYGQMVFDLKSNPLGWDGTIKGLPQSTQVVVWMAEGIGLDNKTHIQKGTCVLIR
ncbi:MAG TPA: T9SS type B sorting domain-containing protein [Chitinophagaceae bacterium]